MRRISVKPAYTPLTQQRMHCVPCSIQWILLRRKLPIFSQEEIGRALKLTVPRELKYLFGKKVLSAAKEPKLGWGSQLGHSAQLINTFFKRKRLPLEAECFPYSKVENPAEFIASHIAKGNDVMLITYMAALDKKLKFGHSLVIANIGGNKVTVGDPAFESSKFYKTPLQKVLNGMTDKWDGVERAFYIFRRKAGQNR